MKTHYFLLGLLLACFTCQSPQKPEPPQKEEQKPKPAQALKEEKEKPAEAPQKYQSSISWPIAHVFMYSLNCSFLSQFNHTGYLFMGKDTSAFELHLQENREIHWAQDALKKDLSSIRSRYKGNYLFHDEKNQLILEILETQVDTFFHTKVGAKPKSSKISRRRVYQIDLDSCNSKLNFQLPDKISPLFLNAYASWVELSPRGQYVSYLEGVREEIDITESWAKVEARYFSPKFEEGIDLEVLSHDAYLKQTKVRFPNQEELYTLQWWNNSLYSGQGSEPVSPQFFLKIRHPDMDDPKNIRLVYNYMQDREEGLADSDFEGQDIQLAFMGDSSALLKKITREDFDQNYRISSYDAALESFCPGSSKHNWPADSCLRSVENEKLQINPQVKRDGPFLLFNLPDSTRLVHRDNAAIGELVQNFFYLGDLSSAEGLVHVTLSHHWEWGNCLLIHENSGDEIYISGNHFPILSPNGKYFVSNQNISNYLMGGVYVQIWEITPAGFKLRGQVIQIHDIPDKYYWLDNQTLIWKSKNFKSVSDDASTRYYQLSWKIPQETDEETEGNLSQVP